MSYGTNIQETHCSNTEEKLWEMEWGGKIIWSHGSTRSRGVAIMFSPKISFAIESIDKDSEGRILLTSIRVEHKLITLCNIYAPNDDNPAFFDRMFALCTTTNNAELILGGDFNLILEPKLDKSPGPLHPNTNSRANFKLHMEELGLCDIFRQRHPMVRKYSRVQTNPVAATRIDFFVISDSLLNNVKTTDIIQGVMSDHKIVTLELTLSSTPRGTGYWKLNTQLLQDENYVSALKQVINDYIANNPKHHVNPHTRWEALKSVFRGESIKYSAKRKKLRLAREHFLVLKIQNLERAITSAVHHPILDDVEKLTPLKQELDKLIEMRTKGAIVRSRVRWAEKGEKNTKYFLNLEKRHASKKAINRLTVDGDNCEEQKTILEKLANFYDHLYQSESNPPNDEVMTRLAKLKLPKISVAQLNITERPITESELRGVIYAMPKNKSPGLDGFPVEFYQTFWSEIKELFWESWEYTDKTGQFSPGQSQGVVTLIPKPKKDPLFITNYRPITLLNVDYKIISKVINNRIKANFDQLVNKDQNGFIKGRFIGDNLRLLFDIIDLADATQSPGAVLSLDIYKAFDTIEWHFIYNVMKTIGFGDKMLHWLKCCYNNPTSKITNNNFLSRSFKVGRGVRQGDPLSPTLFVLCMECLASALRIEDFEGIKLKGNEYKVSLFADDTLVFLRGDQDDFDKVFTVVKDFGRSSGCNMNINKTLAFYIGSKRSLTVQPYLDSGLAWPKNSFNYLGIEIPISSDKNLFDLNFLQIIERTRTILNIWSSRGLSLLGRICILKSLIIPTLIYKVSVIPITLPETFLRQLKRTLFTFIWGSQWERVKRTKLCSNITDGGANMIEIDTYLLALNLKWVTKLFDETYVSPWKNLEIAITNEREFDCWLGSNLTKKSRKLKEIVSLRTIRKAVADCKLFAKMAKLPQNVSRQIWLNKEIRYRTQSFYIKPLVKAGILTHSDLINETGQYFTYDELASKFNFTPNNLEFIEFIKLISAVPVKWDTEELLSSFFWPPDTGWRQTVSTFKSSKATYDHLITFTAVKPLEQQNAWERDLNLEREIPWNSIYNNNYKCTIENKLRSFQIKINLRAIVTNTQLKEFGKIDSELCVFCKHSPETLIHLFYTCPSVRLFWENVTAWISSKLLMNLYPSPLTCIFGTNLQPRNLLNVMLLCARFVIYQSKYAERNPTVQRFVYAVENLKKTEKEIAKKKQALPEFLAKWAGLL